MEAIGSLRPGRGTRWTEPRNGRLSLSSTPFVPSIRGFTVVPGASRHHRRPATVATAVSGMIRRRRRLRGALVPSVKWRVVVRVPRFAQTGLAQIPVGADLAGHGP